MFSKILFTPLHLFCTVLHHTESHQHFICSPFFSDVLRNIMSAGILWFYKKERKNKKSANGSVLSSTVAKAH